MAKNKQEKEYKKIWMSIKKHPIITAVICIAMLPILWPGLRNLIINWQNKPNPSEGAFLSTYIAIMGVIGAGITLYYYWKRLNNQDELINLQQQQNITQTEQLKNQQNQINLQREANIDQRFALAVETLGSREESARTGAIYSLYHLAIENEKYRQSVMDILCSHIRSKTNERQYMLHYKNNPSNEIQSCINTIFKEDGILHKYFSELKQPNLSKSHLNGIDLSHSFCYDTDFEHCYLINANLTQAKFYSADFYKAHCQGADFSFSELYCSSFIDAFLHGAKANFIHACGVSLIRTKCIGAQLLYANLFLADFADVDLSGACLRNAFLYNNGTEHIKLLSSSTDNHSLDQMINKPSNIDPKIFYNYPETNKKNIERTISTIKEILDQHKHQRLNYNVYRKIYDLLIGHNNISDKQIEILFEDIEPAIETGILQDSNLTVAIIDEDWDRVDELA